MGTNVYGQVGRGFVIADPTESHKLRRKVPHHAQVLLLVVLLGLEPRRLLNAKAPLTDMYLQP